jgi:DNA-cytosine methyltransferase
MKETGKETKLIVLSLFNGMSCGQIALDRVGIEVKNYYASEVDKYAIQITQKNYPRTIQLGDVNNIDWNSLEKIDLLLGGSPCQDLSIAKKNREGLKGKKSSLFFKYVEALETIKPKWFIYENVASMKKADKDLITSRLGVEPIIINSSLVSAQQRRRLYWTNIPGVQQPEDKNIYLKHILESGVADRDKSYCMLTNPLAQEKN